MPPGSVGSTRSNLLEDPLLVLLGDALALVGDDDRGEIAFPLGAQPDLAALGRVADRVGDQVHHDLQRAGEIAGRGQRLVGAGRVDADAAIGGAHREQAGGAAGDVGEVDRLGLGPEIGPLDRLQVDEVVDQSEQMAAGRGDVVGIAGIIAAQRAFGLGAQPLGIVDDMGERAAQRLIEPLAEGGAVARRRRGGRRRRRPRRPRRRRRESRRSGPCRRSAARRRAG